LELILDWRGSAAADLPYDYLVTAWSLFKELKRPAAFLFWQEADLRMLALAQIGSLVDVSM
jgi:hypothetical protein